MNLNKFIVGIFFYIFSLNSIAQDTIFLKDSRRIIAKILELNKNEVVFKKYENLEGPNYRINFHRVKKVSLISNLSKDSIKIENYSNNRNDIIADNLDSTERKRKNSIGINVLAFYSNQFNFFYMRSIKDEFFIRIPFYISTQNKNKFMHPKMDLEFRSGTDLLYKPSPKNPYYFGVSSNVGIIKNNYSFYEVTYNPIRYTRPYQPYIYNNWKSYYWGFSITIGNYFQISKHLSIDSFLSTGFINYTNGYIRVEKTYYRNISKKIISPSVYAGFCASYNF